MKKTVVLCCGVTCSAVFSVFSLFAAFHWVQVTASSSATTQILQAQHNVYLWFALFIAGVSSTCALTALWLRPIFIEIITNEVCEEHLIAGPGDLSDSVY